MLAPLSLREAATGQVPDDKPSHCVIFMSVPFTEARFVLPRRFLLRVLRLAHLGDGQLEPRRQVRPLTTPGHHTCVSRLLIYELMRIEAKCLCAGLHSSAALPRATTSARRSPERTQCQAPTTMQRPTAWPPSSRTSWPRAPRTPSSTPGARICMHDRPRCARRVKPCRCVIVLLAFQISGSACLRHAHAPRLY